MSATNDENAPPILKAVSSSARQLTQLLDCIRFAPKAHVNISADGIRFSVEEARVMQGIAFLDKALFTSYTYNPPMTITEHDESSGLEEAPSLQAFQLSLIALLETLHILGFSERSTRFQGAGSEYHNDYTSNIRPHRPEAFSNTILGLPLICRITYAAPGSPLSIILEESGVVTTCNLNTYESDASEEIPFNRTEVDCKIIMQSRYLFDALTELSVLNPSSAFMTSTTKLIIQAFPDTPYLILSSTGSLGSSTVDFAKSKDLLETFQVGRRWVQSYKFEHVRIVLEALKLGSKVSLRGDRQGVLSLQVLVEGEGGVINFVDFRFIPFAEEDAESGSEADEGDDDEEFM